MRASILFEPGKPLEVEDVDLAAPQEDEVRVQMTASGVCHSCLHTADGSWTGFPMPIVLGDEGAGIVEDVGPGVKGLKSGDHVILSWAPACGQCHYCSTGRSQLCERTVPKRGALFRRDNANDAQGQTGLSLWSCRQLRVPFGGACQLRDSDSQRHASRQSRPDRMLGHDGCGRGTEHRPGGHRVPAWWCMASAASD